MALANIYRVVQDLEGNVVTGVLATVTLSGSATLASLFSDAAGTIPLPNPTTNNAQFGSFSLFLAAGTFDMQFVKAGYTFETQRNITLRDPAAGVTTITGTANRVIVAPVPGVGAVTLSTPQDIAPDSNVQFAHIGVGTPATSAPITYADQAGARTALGLGTMAVQDAASVAITGGSAVLSTMQATQVGIGTTPGASGTNLVIASGKTIWQQPAQVGINVSPIYNFQVQGNVGIQVYSRSVSMNALTIVPDSDSGPGSAVMFVNAALGAVGAIVTTATATAYNTASDARLKHAITPLTGALDVVRALRPITHLWNADDSRGFGFLAHELQREIPDAVSGQPDEVNADGSIRPQQVDHSRLVVWLVAAVQELASRVVSLEEQLGI